MSSLFLYSGLTACFFFSFYEDFFQFKETYLEDVLRGGRGRQFFLSGIVNKIRRFILDIC